MQMETTSDVELLQAFVKSRLEPAFRTIVERHSGWLFASAYRQLRDVQLAEDAVQTVFVLLAQKASAMNQDHKLSGWLFNTMGYTVRAMRRNRLRAQKREKRAARQVATLPVEEEEALQAALDAAVHRLPEADRAAILLRYYQNQPFNQVARALNTTEETARKRVERAVARLRRLLGADAEKVAESSFALLAAHGLQHAPPGMTGSVVQSALHSTTLPASTAAAVKGAMVLMAISKLKTAAVLLVLVLMLGGGATFVVLLHSRTSANAGMTVPITAPVASDDIPFRPDLSGVQIFELRGRNNGTDSDICLTRDRGSVQRQSASGWTSIHYFDGPTEYAYREGGNLVLRKKIIINHKIRQASELLSETERALSLQDIKGAREPASDAVVIGKKCEAYRVTEATGIISPLWLLLIDPNSGRVEEMKKEKIDLLVSYDPAVPEQLLRVPSGPGVQIVDARDYFEKQYPLERARYQVEKAGQVFAVQEITQNAAGCFLLVCTTRLSPASKAAAKDVADDELTNGFSIVPQVPGERLHFHMVDIAAFQQSGFEVDYLVVIPQEGFTAADHCQFGVSLRGSTDAQDPLQKEMEPKSPPFAVDLEAKVDAKAESIRDFAGRAYDAVSPLVGTVYGSHCQGPPMGQGLGSREACVEKVAGEVLRYAPDAEGGTP